MFVSTTLQLQYWPMLFDVVRTKNHAFTIILSKITFQTATGEVFITHCLKGVPYIRYFNTN